MQEFFNQSATILGQFTDLQLLGASALLLFLILCLPVLLFLLLSARRVKIELNAIKETHHLERQSFLERLEEKNVELDKKNDLINRLHHVYGEQKELIGKLSTLLAQEKKISAEKLELLEKAKNELSLQFQSLAHQIFTENVSAFSSQSKETLQSALSPFQELLNSFKQQIDDTYHRENKERVTLQQEITNLRDLNLKINQEALNLTNALKGDQKIQGNWGEMVLENVLEQSGLRKGYEFETQSGFRNKENKLLKPDVIVHLPNERDVVIDSKVSLVAWEKYVNATSESEKKQHLADHLKSVGEHITRLGRKDYSELSGVRSLDFILLFMPIEAAFALSFEQDEKLFSLAFANRIVIVSPTTLLATLRSIESIWRQERQHRNSQEIAGMAGRIYDKLCSFAEDMEKIGKQLETVSSTYDTAISRLSQGRGNLISQANRLSELGVKAKKELPKTITQQADLDLVD